MPFVPHNQSSATISFNWNKHCRRLFKPCHFWSFYLAQTAPLWKLPRLLYWQVKSNALVSLRTNKSAREEPAQNAEGTGSDDPARKTIKENPERSIHLTVALCHRTKNETQIPQHKKHPGVKLVHCTWVINNNKKTGKSKGFGFWLLPSDNQHRSRIPGCERSATFSPRSLL